MPAVHIRPDWWIPESESTPESMYLNRRRFLQGMGMGGLMLAGLNTNHASAEVSDLPAYITNPDFADAGRPVTRETLTQGFNNFYEFGFGKTDPVQNAQGFSLDPYNLTIDGLCDNPTELDLDQIEKLGLEERTYRFRCVEAWSMTVPWIGVPLKKLVELAQPKSEAKYVAFTCFHDPERAPGQKDTRYPWPYFEGLRIDEARPLVAALAEDTGYYRILREAAATAIRRAAAHHHAVEVRIQRAEVYRKNDLYR